MKKLLFSLLACTFLSLPVNAQEVSSLDPLSGAPASNDLFYIVDTSASAGRNINWDEMNSNIMPEFSNIQNKTTNQVTVCASNTAFFSDCDYTCDGTADEVQINQALDLANTYGAVNVILSDGEFELADSIVFKYTRQFLTGQNSMTQIVPANSSSFDMMISDTDTVQVGILIKGMAIDAEQTTGRVFYDSAGSSYHGDVHIVGIEIYNYNDVALEFDSPWGLLIDDTIIELGGGLAIKTNGSEDIKIFGNKIINNVGGIDINSAMAKVIGNTIGTNSTTASIINRQSGSTIIGNTFRDEASSVGIGISSIGDYNVYANNVFTCGQDMTNAITFESGSNENIFVNNVIGAGCITAPVVDGGVDNVISFNNADGDLIQKFNQRFVSGYTVLIGAGEYAFAYDGDSDSGVTFNTNGNGSIDIKNLTGDTVIGLDLNSRIILRSPDTTCSACTVDNSDAFACASITCPTGF